MVKIFKKLINFESLLIFISVFLFLFFLKWHLDLGLNRYFDADELAHLHWTSHFLMGKKPYLDFMLFFPPGFMAFLALAFSFGWGTVTPFITARFMSFIVFTLLCISLGLVYWEVRRNWMAIVAMVLLAFLPVPFDKYLEIRPDNLATLFLMLGIYFQIRWMKYYFHKSAFISGFLYSLSVIVLTKMLPNIAVSIVVVLFYLVFSSNEIKKKNISFYWDKSKYFILGLVFPVLLLSIYFLSLGDIDVVIYSLMKLPIESNKISRYFIMQPELFFYPNGIYYGQDGWNRGLFTNHIFWIIGLIFGVYRLLTPYLTDTYKELSRSKNSGKGSIYGEILLGLQFIVQVIFFVLYVPLKHAQYLIPIGVFIAFYNTDLIDYLRKTCQVDRILKPIFVFGFTIFILYLYQVFGEIQYIKRSWTNREFLNNLQIMYTKIPQDELLLDLDGKMLYNPDPYYVCCIPFGQFSEFLSRPLPNLIETLEKTKTRYINQGGLKRVGTLNYIDQNFINSNYHSFFGDDTFLIRN